MERCDPPNHPNNSELKEAGSVRLVVLAPTLVIHRNAHRQRKSRNEFTELFIFAGEESNQYCCICCFCKTMLGSQVTCSRITVQPIRSSTPSHWVSGKHEDAQAQLSKGLGCTETIRIVFPVTQSSKIAINSIDS